MSAYPSVKAYVKVLMLQAVSRTDYGRAIGLSYGQMLELVRKEFPVNRHPGPHVGKPLRMSIKQMREIVYDVQAEDRSILMPVRPRSDRKDKKVPPCQ